MLGSVVALEGWWCVTPCHVHDKITQLSCCAALLHRARLEPLADKITQFDEITQLCAA